MCGFVPCGPRRRAHGPRWSPAATAKTRLPQPAPRGHHALRDLRSGQALRSPGARRVPSVGTKRVSPHVIRHTTAIHLLRGAVDISTIRAWLGHVSQDTTNIYAEVDLEMKAKALNECSITSAPHRSWRKEPGLMAFLRSL